MKYIKSLDISKLSSNLPRIIKKSYSIKDDLTAKQIAKGYVVSNLGQIIKQSVQVLQLSGYASLDALLEPTQSKLIRESISF